MGDTDSDLESLGDELVETLRWLVDIPSVTGDEAALCDAIAQRLESTGVPQRRVGNTLVVGEPDDRPTLLLVGHIDTVPNQGQGPAFVEGDRMMGLGVSDMKGGVAVMTHLLEAPDLREGRFNLVGIYYDKEEGPAADNGLISTVAEIGWLGDAAFAVVMEPTDLELQLGCVGSVNATVRFDGVAAHAARPWFGENAVTKAGRFLASLHEQGPIDVVVGGLTFREVMTVTRAHGGVADNIVPPSFELNLNYRYAPDKTPEQAIAMVRGVAAEADDVEIAGVSIAAPVVSDHPLLTELQYATDAVVAPKQAWTDVARFAELGVPAVNYGPGETAQAHQVTESIPVANLGAAYAGLQRFING